jgi:hypothetical protein
MMKTLSISGWLLVVGLFLAGCDNTIEPLSDEGDSMFAINGYLDMRASLQQIRIEALRPTILSEVPSLEGVEVYTLDHSTGSLVEWRDSTVIISGEAQHGLFVANFVPRLGHFYQFMIDRNDERVADGSVQMPSAPEVFVSEAVGDSVYFRQNMVLSGIHAKPLQVFVRYVVSTEGMEGTPTIRVAYGEPGRQTSDGWTLDIDLAGDRAVILHRLDRVGQEREVIIHGVSIEMAVLSEEWNSPDSEANLINAHGFLGAVGVFEHSWRLSPDTIGLLGMQDGQR